MMVHVQTCRAVQFTVVEIYIQLLCSCLKFKVIYQLAPPLAIAIAKQHPCKLHQICTKTTTKVLYTALATMQLIQQN